jgi:hypothetical protein
LPTLGRPTTATIGSGMALQFWNSELTIVTLN